MRSYFSFLLLWVKKTFQQSLGMADFMSGLSGIAIAAYDDYHPESGLDMDSLAWQVPLYAFAVVGFVRFFISPYLLWKEQKEAAELPEKQRNEQKEKILPVFHKLLDTGNALLVKRISQNQFEEWKKEVQEFRVLALTMISNHISRTQAIKFNVTRVERRNNYIFKVSDDHNGELQMLAAQMEKFLEIVQEYERPNA